MDIHDPRTVVDFQKFTFSGHLRTHVYKVLNENIKLGHADYACYWTLELLCSGLVNSLWQTLFESSAQNINRATPNVFLYLVKMYEKFSPYEQQYEVMRMTDIRNNSEVRNLVCEVAASVAMCRKHKIPSLPRIKPEHDFNQITIQENLKSPSANYARHLAKENDPLELYIPFNELVYSLKAESRDIARALYWSAWILSYAKHFKQQRKEALVCHPRPNQFIDDAGSTHIVWMMWDAIHDAVKHSPQSGILHAYIDSMFKMYCLRWASGNSKQRMCFYISSILFICESTSLDIHTAVPSDVSKVHAVVENIPQWISAILQTQKTFSN
jgi:hypothetical protein